MRRFGRSKPLALGLFSAALSSASCSTSSSETPPQDAARYSFAPNVLLVTIDTLRADHLSCYGHFRETSPHIDALAAESLLYERAHSTSGTTLPSHLSILTGLYPHQHGHVSNKGAMKGPYKPAPGREPVGEYFRRAGYQTAAFVSGNTVKRTTGVHHGFEVWSQPPTLHRQGEDTRGLAVEWLEGREREGTPPFFLWVHFWDVHEPNDPPEPWRSYFRADGRVEALLAERRVDPALLQEKFSPIEIARLFYPDLVDPLLHGEDLVVPQFDQSKLLELIDAYDGSIRYVDEQVGALIATLDELGLADRTIVAITADHGQALGQHDWLEHGEIRGEEVHVPLVLRFPGTIAGAPRRIADVVSLVDLMPTIAARIEGEPFRAFAEQASGSDLLDPGAERAWAFSYRTEREREWEQGRKFSVTVGNWRFYDLEEGPDELYDLSRDPGELENVIDAHPEKARELGDVVREVLSTNPADGSTRGTLTDEERLELERELRQTGYIGDEDEDGEEH